MNNVTMMAFCDELEKIGAEKDSGFIGDVAAKAKGVLTTPIAGTPSLNPFHAASTVAQSVKTPGQASRGFEKFQQMRAAAGH